MARLAGIEPTTFSFGGGCDDTVNSYSDNGLSEPHAKACASACFENSQKDLSATALVDAINLIDRLPLTPEEKARLISLLISDASAANPPTT